MSSAIPQRGGGNWGPSVPQCHQRGLGEGRHVSEAKAVLETLLCPIVLLGWNHKPQSEKHRCAAFFFQ